MQSRKRQHASVELLAAQQRLLELRASLPTRDAVPCISGTVARPKRPSPVMLGQSLLLERRRREAERQGGRASDALKAALPAVSIAPVVTEAPQFPTPPKTTKKNIRRKIKVYPGLAIGALEAGLAAPGRIYWLLKHLDRQGRGWIAIEEARNRLTDKKSELRVCGWRRLRQLLHQGEGAFWQRDRRGRIWLSGAATVAQNLSVGRLTGKPVEFPVSTLLGGIQGVRAHFFASFHSGRRESNPISREKLREMTGVPERTQQEYDRTARVKREQNLAIGGRYSKQSAEARSWQQGRAAFQFVDIQGQQGAAGREYVAWRLPNSYHGPHSQCNKGRQKKINQRLVDLVMKGMQGNDPEQVDKVFWPNGAAAGRGYTRDQANDAYWPQGQTRPRTYHLWHVLPGEREGA